MTFIDLLASDFAHACTAPTAPRWGPARGGRVPRRTRLRLAAALAVIAAIATPALAIGLRPLLSDFEGQPVSTTADTPPGEQLALLGILRDPPAAARVDPATLRSAILPGVRGIRMNYVRRLPPAPGFPFQLLYTVTSSDFGPARFNPTVGAPTPTEAKNGICLQRVETGGVGGTCAGTSVLTSGRWLESHGLDGYGLVPDGVARVVLHYRDHPDETENVTENTFSFVGYPGLPGPTIGGGGQPSPGPTPEFPATITWLDANGKVLSTHALAEPDPSHHRADGLVGRRR